ncbi:hypothetical protein LPJ53_006169, partial [Coemansia erecta]
MEAVMEPEQGAFTAAKDGIILKKSIKQLGKQYSNWAQQANDCLEAMEKGFEDMRGMIAALLQA